MTTPQVCRRRRCCITDQPPHSAESFEGKFQSPLSSVLPIEDEVGSNHRGESLNKRSNHPELQHRRNPPQNHELYTIVYICILPLDNKRKSQIGIMRIAGKGRIPPVQSPTGCIHHIDRGPGRADHTTTFLYSPREHSRCCSQKRRVTVNCWV